jgi:hypothetical protein
VSALGEHARYVRRHGSGCRAARLGEELVAEATGGQLVGRGHKGYDVLLEDGERVQVKTRSLSVMR